MGLEILDQQGRSLLQLTRRLVPRDGPALDPVHVVDIRLPVSDLSEELHHLPGPVQLVRRLSFGISEVRAPEIFMSVQEPPRRRLARGLGRVLQRLCQVTSRLCLPRERTQDLAILLPDGLLDLVLLCRGTTRFERNPLWRAVRTKYIDSGHSTHLARRGSPAPRRRPWLWWLTVGVDEAFAIWIWRCVGIVRRSVETVLWCRYVQRET